MTGDPGEPVRGRTILVVDDSAANRYSLARMLQVAGFEVIECSSGSQALQADLRKVSAVVLDVNLPDVHGFEVCRLLRAGAASAHLPIVHVSAIHVSGEDLLAGLAAGADAYYTSPVDPQVLTATLRSLIQARTLTRSLEDRVQLFRGAFDCAPCALAVFDGNGRFPMPPSPVSWAPPARACCAARCSASSRANGRRGRSRRSAAGAPGRGTGAFRSST